MTLPRFNLRVFLTAITLLCIVTGAISTSNAAFFLFAIAVWSIAGGVWGVRRGDNSVGGAILGGVAAGVALALGVCLANLIGYFTYNGVEPYFEDGPLVELVFFLIIGSFVYGLFGAAFGFVVGLVVWLLSDVVFSRPDRAAQIRPAASNSASPWQ